MTAYCSITNLVTNSARAAVTLRPEAGAEAGDDAPVLLKQGCCCCRRHHYRHRHRHHHRHRPLRPRPVLLPLANCEVNLPSFRLWEEALLLPLGERRRMDTAEKGMTGGAAAGSMDRMHTGGCLLAWTCCTDLFWLQRLRHQERQPAECDEDVQQCVESLSHRKRHVPLQLVIISCLQYLHPTLGLRYSLSNYLSPIQKLGYCTGMAVWYWQFPSPGYWYRYW